MKEITKCIGDIGRANSTIFSTLDLTSGFWQMQLDENSQPLTTFTIPGRGQYQWITSSIGPSWLPSKLSTSNGGCVMQHCQHHCLHQWLTRPHKNTWGAFKSFVPSFGSTSNPQSQNQPGQMLFWQQRVSYLGFTLKPEGIKHGNNQLRAIKDVKPPKEIKTICSFVRLCNFFI